MARYTSGMTRGSRRGRGIADFDPHPGGGERGSLPIIEERSDIPLLDGALGSRRHRPGNDEGDRVANVHPIPQLTHFNSGNAMGCTTALAGSQGSRLATLDKPLDSGRRSALASTMPRAPKIAAAKARDDRRHEAKRNGGQNSSKDSSVQYELTRS